MSLLMLRNVSVSYGLHRVLHNLSFSVSAGEMLAVIGPNGSGKTTLLKSIVGIVPICQGSIKIHEQNIKKTLKTKKGIIFYLPQHHSVNLLLPLTVYDVVAQGLKAQKLWGQSLNKEDHIKIEQALTKVQMVHKSSELFFCLSGGQRQRALLALALINTPQLLLLDEPTSGLDFSSIDKIYQILSEIKSEGMGIIMISHDISSIVSSADTVAVLMQTFKYYGTPNCLPEDVIHSVFGSHIKIIPNEPTCHVCISNNK